MDTTYVAKVKDQWATHSTRSFRNFGITSTSRTEGLHAQLKRFLSNRLASLSKLGAAIVLFIDKQHSRYSTSLAKQDTKFCPKHRNTPVMRLVLFEIGWKAKEMVWQQYVAARDHYEQGECLPTTCSGRFWKQWGLPCRHTIYDRLEKAEECENGIEMIEFALKKEDFDTHWYLRREVPLSSEETALREENDPLVVPRRKPGATMVPKPPNEDLWPKFGSKRENGLEGNWNAGMQQPRQPQPWQDNSTRRDPSAWEEGRRRKKPCTGTRSTIQSATSTTSIAASGRGKRRTKKQIMQDTVQETTQRMQEEMQQCARKMHAQMEDHLEAMRLQLQRQIPSQFSSSQYPSSQFLPPPSHVVSHPSHFLLHNTHSLSKLPLQGNMPPPSQAITPQPQAVSGFTVPGIASFNFSQAPQAPPLSSQALQLPSPSGQLQGQSQGWSIPR